MSAHDVYNFTAVGNYRNLTVTVKCSTFESAMRACRQILSHNDVIESARIEDRKGNVLKVIKRHERSDG